MLPKDIYGRKVPLVKKIAETQYDSTNDAAAQSRVREGHERNQSVTETRGLNVFFRGG